MYRQFLSSQTQRLFGYIVGNSFYFKDYTTRSNRYYKSYGITFTFTHTYVCRLFGNGLVREYPAPYLAFTLHISCHGDTCCFELTAVNPFRIKCLYAEAAKRQLITALGVAFAASFRGSSPFCSFRL